MDRYEREHNNSPILERLDLYVCQGKLIRFTHETIESFDYEDLIDTIVPKLGKGAIVVPAKFNQEIYQLADEDRCAIIRINYE